MTNNTFSVPLDIFVICYERSPMLESCLESIRRCTSNIEHRISVIEGKRSAAENRNIAISRVSSPWFVMMDDDVIVTPGWLDTMLEHIDDSVGQIQPKLLFSNGKIFSAEKVFTTPWGDNIALGMNERDNGQFDYTRVAELLSGTCCLYNSKILQSCKFDNCYQGAQWEDCDFSMQIRKKGFYLLYCGEAKVQHLNMYRNPNAENFTYFRNKWFGNRELVRRGPLYVGFACDINCVFCFYRFEKNKKFRPIDELKKESDKFRKFYGNTSLDITGGEPTMHPHIVELVRHCREIGLAPTVITHGQRLTKELVENLKQAGIEDFLISYHGTEKEHDYLVKKIGAYKAMRQGVENVMAANIPFRFNTVVTKINYKILPSLAKEFIDLKLYKVNFIMFTPWDTWLTHQLEDFHGRYSDMAPYLKETILILQKAGIQSIVSYIPFCLFDGFEKYVMNYPQTCFVQLCLKNNWAWDYKWGHPLRGEYDYLYYALLESRIRYNQPQPCKRCALRLICSGLPKRYVETEGCQELKPLSGMLVRDPIYFHTNKVEESISIEHPLCTFLRENFESTYPGLKNADPLFLHQVTPLKDIKKPLARAGHSLLRRIVRGSINRMYLLFNRLRINKWHE